MNSSCRLENVGLFSGGKDSLASCHYAKVKKVVYCHTGIGLNFDYVLKMCDKLGWNLTVLYPKENEDYESFIKKFGFPHYMMHSGVMAYLKMHPLRKYFYEQTRLGRTIIWISGRRKAESARRKRMVSNKTARSHFDGMDWYSPLFEWNTPQIYQYLKDNNLELSPIYSTMHMSGDCFCGAFSKRGESFLLNIFHKELANKIKILEQKYNSKWGNKTSMTEASKQGTLDDLICSECILGDI